MPAASKHYFLADVHLGLQLGDPVARERDFASFLYGLADDPQTAGLWLLGDIFDFWYEYKHVIPRHFTRTLGALARLADKGVDVHIFAGNHDVWLYDYLQTELGLQVHRQGVFFTEIAGQGFALAHGDLPSCAPLGYRLLYRVFHCRFLQRLFSTLHPRWAFGLAHAWSRHNRLTKPQAYLFDPATAPLFAYAQGLEAQHVIMGHLHSPGSWPLGPGRQLHLLGAWLHGPHYLLFDGKTLRRITEA